MQNYQSPYKQFIFEGWKQEGSKLVFSYSFDGQLKFQEVLEWPEGTEFPDSRAFKNAAELYLLLAGVSYYKVFPTSELVYAEIDREQAGFIESVYKNGLGEFIYVNQLSPDVIGHFVSVNEDAHEQAGDIEVSDSLVMIGGGKDSLVTVDLLKKAGKNFTTFRVNSKDWVDAQMQKIGLPSSKIIRIIDPKLTEMKDKGALNGHVPVTAIVSSAALLEAIRLGRANVISSSEASANIPNTEYEGMQINHQYSKSLELEIALNKYIKHYVSPSLTYFSLLRPWSELKIVEYFANNLFDEYSGMWSSSNHNFMLKANSQKPEWDPNYSAKTLAIFGMFAAFIEPKRLIREMGGDYFESEEFADTWAELVGNKGIKPFECVADIVEMRLAIKLAQENGWQNAQKIEVGQPECNYEAMNEHAIPEEYERII